ncbi:hypothetical protein [Phytohabitans rumicis]|uniref:Uncharacterized protein n=1 Tax=Phytohabitans rumicis TaxID=1076125 RepID=A0A6V8LHW1_9ACTN|nr:hypothetical protein [Phytohabitans rumicis]GFJ93697.1 hypothetical protein Prum_073390 [Phytohabitans rumicis]
MSYVGIDPQGSRELGQVLQNAAERIDGLRRNLSVALDLVDLTSQVPAQLSLVQDGFTTLATGLTDKVALAERYATDRKGVAASPGTPAGTFGASVLVSSAEAAEPPKPLTFGPPIPPGRPVPPGTPFLPGLPLPEPILPFMPTTPFRPQLVDPPPDAPTFPEFPVRPRGVTFLPPENSPSLWPGAPLVHPFAVSSDPSQELPVLPPIDYGRPAFPYWPQILLPELPSSGDTRNISAGDSSAPGIGQGGAVASATPGTTTTRH